jgi:hypothetical protein
VPVRVPVRVPVPVPNSTPWPPRPRGIRCGPPNVERETKTGRNTPSATEAFAPGGFLSFGLRALRISVVRHTGLPGPPSMGRISELWVPESLAAGARPSRPLRAFPALDASATARPPPTTEPPVRPRPWFRSTSEAGGTPARRQLAEAPPSMVAATFRFPLPARRGRLRHPPARVAPGGNRASRSAPQAHDVPDAFMDRRLPRPLPRLGGCSRTEPRPAPTVRAWWGRPAARASRNAAARRRFAGGPPDAGLRLASPRPRRPWPYARGRHGCLPPRVDAPLPAETGLGTSPRPGPGNLLPRALGLDRGPNGRSPSRERSSRSARARSRGIR